MSPEEGAECGQQRHDGRSRRFRSNPIALFCPTLLDLLLVVPWGSDRGAARLRRDGWYTFLCASSRLLAPTTHRVRLRQLSNRECILAINLIWPERVKARCRRRTGSAAAAGSGSGSVAGGPGSASGWATSMPAGALGVASDSSSCGPENGGAENNRPAPPLSAGSRGDSWKGREAGEVYVPQQQPEGSLSRRRFSSPRWPAASPCSVSSPRRCPCSPPS